MDYYVSNPRFYVAVDCIIFGFRKDSLKLLLLKRNFEPAMGKWSLMGGFVQEGESVHMAAVRVLRELTGLDNVFLDQVHAYGETERDPGSRVISVSYYALINISEYDEQLVKEHNAFWVDIHELPELIFDHGQMVTNALKKLRQKAAIRSIGLNLLPDEFSLTQLQSLYEAIYDEKLDKRNFRKKIASLSAIRKTGNIDKTTSKKGAALYCFDKTEYSEADRFDIIDYE
ncbi:MAG: NUDIX hydrolase [Bacteroidales bacterium]|nr:NUDIX hydrolase [Bacteroidales bacterium]